MDQIANPIIVPGEYKQIDVDDVELPKYNVTLVGKTTLAKVYQRPSSLVAPQFTGMTEQQAMMEYQHMMQRNMHLVKFPIVLTMMASLSFEEIDIILGYNNPVDITEFTQQSPWQIVNGNVFEDVDVIFMDRDVEDEYIIWCQSKGYNKNENQKIKDDN